MYTTHTGWTSSPDNRIQAHALAAQLRRKVGAERAILITRRLLERHECSVTSEFLREMRNEIRAVAQ